MRLLLIEDDEILGDGIRAGLRQAGFAVDWMRDGTDAVEALSSSAYDALVLDLGLPGMDGLDVLAALRRAGSTVPVLILTARDTVADRVRGLDAGADDYLVKPFELAELQARVRALLRRHAGRGVPVLRHGRVLLDPAAHVVSVDGRTVNLSAKEFAILEELLGHQGRVLSQEALEERIYGWGDELSSNAIQVHIHYIREKLGIDLIRTIRGVGYMIDRLESGTP